MLRTIARFGVLVSFEYSHDGQSCLQVAKSTIGTVEFEGSMRPGDSIDRDATGGPRR